MRFALAGSTVLALSGCTWTAFSAVSATGTMIQAGLAMKANYASPKFVNGRPASVHDVCIEFNTNVPVGDFIPALQLALDRRGVRSEVYNPGTAPPMCEARLVYNAAIDYGRSSFSHDETSPYLSAIELTLLEQNRILVTARYEVRGMGLDRFSSASIKLTGLIDQMVVDQTLLPAASVPARQLN